MKVIKLVVNEISKILGAFFISDMDVMSEEARKIFSNAEDRKKYMDAVEKLKDDNSKEQTITLSTKEKITLVS